MATKLTPRQPDGESHIQCQLQSFGVRLRELRLNYNWTLDDLARQSGLSKAFLSRLESGGRQASIAAVLTLSQVFNVSVASLFESPVATEPCLVVRAADMVEKSSNGLRYAPLSSGGRFLNLRPIKVTVPVSRRGTEHYHHDGEEWVYVLSGQLTLSLAGKTYDLAPGNAAHFDSRLPHRLIARGDHDATVLLVAAPVTGMNQMMLPPVSQHRAIPAFALSTLPLPGGRSAKLRPTRMLTPKTKLKTKLKKP